MQEQEAVLEEFLDINTPPSQDSLKKAHNLPENGSRPTYKFDLEQDYAWKASDSFQLKGKELEILHNTLGAIFGGQTFDAQMYLMLNECFKISSDIIKRNVENGKIAPKPPDAEMHNSN